MLVDDRLLRRARHYGETKRGKDTLNLLVFHDCLRVEVTDGELEVAAELRAGEFDDLTFDESVARVCDVIDVKLHDLRELRGRRK